MPNLEEIADEIKLELHDKHMMHIDGEDSVTHRWCKQIIWRVLNKYFSKMPKCVITIQELEHFLWKLDHASAELNSFVDSNHSVSELDRVDECNEFLNDALYENCNDSEMTFPEKLKEVLQYLAYQNQNKDA